MTAYSRAIRGYAVPFNSIGSVNGTYEKFAPGAFSGMFPLRQAIDVRWFDHSASATRLANTACGTLSLFVDEYGLAFEAQLDMSEGANWSRLREMTRRLEPVAFASIGGLIIKARFARKSLAPQNAKSLRPPHLITLR